MNDLLGVMKGRREIRVGGSIHLAATKFAAQPERAMGGFWLT
jgi:hypothetical protein